MEVRRDNVDRFWTWGGNYFGYRDGDDLRTHYGVHVGKFYGEEIYGSDGYYLGEIKNEKRLITKVNKKSRKKSGFNPRAKKAGLSKYSDYTGYTMYLGSEDFPVPEQFRG